MRKLQIITVLFSILGVTGQLLKAAEAQKKIKPEAIAVLEFVHKGSITDEQAEALSDMLANLIRTTGVKRVIGMADIRASLQLEENKNMLGCNDQSCIAELGGSLGVPWVVSGTLSRFGETWLMNLKLINVEKVEVASGVSRSVAGTENKLIESLPDAVQELLTGVSGVRGEGSMLFMRQRKGRIPISLTIGLSGTIPPHRTNEDTQAADYNQLGPLNEPYAAFHSKFFIGYAFLDWLTIGPRLDFMAGGDLKEQDRKVVGFAGSLEIQAMLPLNHYFSPIFFIAGGVGKVWDKDRHGSDDYDTLSLNLEIGFGGMLFLAEKWFLAGRIAAIETVYFGIHDSTDRRLKSMMLGTSINFMLTVGYEI